MFHVEHSDENRKTIRFRWGLKLNSGLDGGYCFFLLNRIPGNREQIHKEKCFKKNMM